MLSRTLAELVAVRNDINKISAKKNIEKKDEDGTQMQEEMKISDNGEGVKKKMIKAASDLGASGKEVELGEKGRA